MKLEPTDSDWPRLAQRAVDEGAAEADSIRTHLKWTERRVQQWTLRPLYDERMAAKGAAE